MVFHGSRLVCHASRWVFRFLKAPGWFLWFFTFLDWFFMGLGWFSMLFNVPGWFFILLGLFFGFSVPG